jgi:hypothetical protein
MNDAALFDAFLTAIAAGDDDATERLALQLTPDAEPALLALLMAPDADQRWWGVRALARCGGTAAVPVWRRNLPTPIPASARRRCWRWRICTDASQTR